MNALAAADGLGTWRATRVSAVTVTTDLSLVFACDVLLLALALLGVGDNEARAMTTMGAVSMMSLTVIGWFAVRHFSNVRVTGFLILQAGFAYWYLLPMLMTAGRGEVYLAPGFRSFSAAQLRMGCVAVALAKLVTTLTYHVVRLRPVLNAPRIERALRTTRFEVPVLVIAGLLVLGLLPFVVSDKPLAIAILGSRSAEGIFPTSNFDSPLYALTSFLTVSCLLGSAGILFGRSRRVRWMSGGLAMAAVAVSALALSTRTTLLAMILPGLTVYLRGRPDRWRVFKVAACLAALWFTGDLLLNLRTRGFLQPGSGTSAAARSGNLVDNDFYGELLFAMEVVPDELPFSYESPLGQAAVTIIPRSLWPGKPFAVNAGQVMRIRLHDLNVVLTGSALPGIVGQYWEVAGWVGVLIGAVWFGAATAMADWVMRTAGVAVQFLAVAFMWSLFISFRTLAFSIFLPTLVCVVTVLFFSRVGRPARG